MKNLLGYRPLFVGAFQFVGFSQLQISINQLYSKKNKFIGYSDFLGIVLLRRI
jgi:hypothetical protein